MYVLSELLPAEQVVRAGGSPNLVDPNGGRAYLATIRCGATDPVEGMLLDLVAAAHQTGLAMAAAAGDPDAPPEARVGYAGAGARVIRAAASAAEGLARYRTAGAAATAISGAELVSKRSEKAA